MPDVFHPMATAIFRKALADDRCGEVMECLFDGGSVTIDIVTGELVLVSAAALAQMAGSEDDTTEVELLDEYVAVMRKIHTTLGDAYGHAEAPYEPQALAALALAKEALDWVDDPAEPIG